MPNLSRGKTIGFGVIYLDNQLHQFALYMKRTHQNFPNSLLQQYNFETNTIGAPAEANEEATDTDEPEEEVAAETQAEVESEDVDPSDQPEEECDKSETDSLPTEVDDNSEKEREEPFIPTQSKTKKRHIIQEEEEKDPEEEPSILVLAGKGKGNGKVKMATTPAFADEMEQVDAKLAAAVTRVTSIPAAAKQLLDIIVTITTEGQTVDASTPIPPQQTFSQLVRTSPRHSSKRKGSTSKGTATATLPQPKRTKSVASTPTTPATTPLTSLVQKKTKTLSATSPQASLKDKLHSASKRR